MFAGIEKLCNLANKVSQGFIFIMLILILSKCRFINKMSFGPTLFSQNYPNDPVGET